MKLDARLITYLYSALAITWVILSNAALSWFDPYHSKHAAFSLAFGFLFVLLTAFPFYRVVKQTKNDQVTAQEKLRLINSVFENTLEGVVILNSDMEVVAANPAFCRISGYSSNEVLGQKATIPHPAINNAATSAALWDAIRHTGKWQGEIWGRRKDGEIFPEQLTMCALKNKNGIQTHYAAIFNDISQSKRDEQTIIRLAYHDALTGLPNRMLFYDRLETAIGHAHHYNEKAAILLIDFDRFKVINDTLGHAAGDELLRRAANRLLQQIREGDTLARMGADEFAIILPDIGQPESVLPVTSRILSACRQVWDISEASYHLTASIGLAIYPDDGNTAEILMKSADIALYRAKESGKNSCQMASAATNEKALERLQLESDLRRALEQDQFIIYFQPQVDTVTGYMSGAEVLLRWQHPVRGMISPAQFIPLAEETGLIIPIGEWVLKTACAQMAEWSQRNLPITKLSVNLSARQFSEQNLLSTITETITASGINPNMLELEITESIAMYDIEYTVATLKSLKSLGLSISLDDFGTGYSSLVYLKQLPIDTLKIDQSFVQGLSNSSDDATIIDAIIGLAGSLRLRVIAEGVETAFQADFLRQRICHTMQGYHFSPPVPAREFEHFLRGQCKI